MESYREYSNQYLAAVRIPLTLPFSFMLKRLCLSITLFSFIVTLCICIVYSSPSWLETDAYVKYGYSTSLEWRCTGLAGPTAELNVSYSYNDTKTLTATVRVNMESREVFLDNGTYLGKTTLWLVPNPANDQVIELGDGESGEATSVGSWIPTIQGDQKIYIIQSRSYGGYYDLDTGILLGPSYNSIDPALSKIGFPSIPTSITSTNIDLGPRELWPEIIMAMPYILIAVAIVTVPAFVYLKRRQKRRQKAMLAERRQKKTKINSRPS